MKEEYRISEKTLAKVLKILRSKEFDGLIETIEVKVKTKNGVITSVLTNLF